LDEPRIEQRLAISIANGLQIPLHVTAGVADGAAIAFSDLTEIDIGGVFRLVVEDNRVAPVIPHLGYVPRENARGIVRIGDARERIAPEDGQDVVATEDVPVRFERRVVRPALDAVELCFHARSIATDGVAGICRRIRTWEMARPVARSRVALAQPQEKRLCSCGQSRDRS